MLSATLPRLIKYKVRPALKGALKSFRMTFQVHPPLEPPPSSFLGLSMSPNTLSFALGVYFLPFQDKEDHFLCPSSHPSEEQAFQIILYKKKKKFYLFMLIFGHTLWYVGSQLPDQGPNLHPWFGRQSLNPWITSEIPGLFIQFLNHLISGKGSSRQHSRNLIIAPGS